MLTSTNVPETVAATYSSGTTYGLGARAGAAPVAGSAQVVYESLQAGNLAHAQSDTAWWKVVGEVYPAYDAGVTYADLDIVSSISTDVHLLYRSLVAGNIGQALTDTTKWQPYGSTNAHRLFDDVYGSQTTNADTIVMTITPGVIIDCLFLGNLDAASVTLSQSVSGWSQTIALNTHNVNNWYDWYYQDLVRKTDIVFVNIPPYINGVLTLTIDNTGGTAACGVCAVGKKTICIGKTRWELKAGIIPYSGTTTDAFGNTKFLPRPSAKRVNLELNITKGLESEAHRLLTLYSDTPMVFIGSDQEAMTMVYGSLGVWEVPYSAQGVPINIELRGLT
jgi:hypothetical protein